MITVREISNLNDLKSFYEDSAESLHIVKLGATWCGPCRNLSDTLKNLDNEKIGDTLIAEVDIDNEGGEEIASEYNIRNIPVTLFIKNGELLSKSVGYIQPEIIYNKINEYK
jgi:thioredoxin 1